MRLVEDHLKQQLMISLLTSYRLVDATATDFSSHQLSFRALIDHPGLVPRAQSTPHLWGRREPPASCGPWALPTVVGTAEAHGTTGFRVSPTQKYKAACAVYYSSGAVP